MLIHGTNFAPARPVWSVPGHGPLFQHIAKFRTDELRSHIHRALDNGVTEEEIGELICHLAFYAGWPNAFSAVPVVKGVFESRSK